MALVTGTPLGQINAQDELYIDAAPTIYFQDYEATELSNPDGDGFYWGLSGTTTYPVYSLACYEDVVWASEYESNAIRCDTVGDKSNIQKLNHIDLTFTLKTLMPLATLTHILRGGAVTTSAGATEKMGIGQPNNQQFYHYYLVSVYDETAGDHITVTAHKAQFVDAWEIGFTYGEPATIGMTFRAFADDTKPAAQLFATIIRADPSAI
jgi:hypothetical protein